MRFISDFDFKGKKILIRADLNVPFNEGGEISDDNRIKQFLPTLKCIFEAGGRCIIMSHLGRPSGAVDERLSLKPVAERLSKLTGKPVRLAPDCIGPEIEKAAAAMQDGEIMLLENLRFHAGEKKNNAEFSAMLARLGDIYINDAFATSHREHASMVGVPKLIAEKGLGLLVQKELEYYEKALIKPKKPLCFVVGGAKVSTKLKALVNLSTAADKIIVGGAMANTFLAAQGFQMGKSLLERDLFGPVIELLARLARNECKVYLPVDFTAGPSPQSKGMARDVTAQEFPADLMALDIGPGTAILYKEAVVSCETIVWNGPMGVFENEEYSKGTLAITEAIASAHGLSVAGGGDTDAAIHSMELGHKFDFISTGGGAFLYLLEGRQLPAIQALE